MDEQLKVDKQALRRFIQRWDDQKLADVMAFNQDERMRYLNPCSCLLGVASSQVLHQVRCYGNHYRLYRTFFHDARVAEYAYKRLGGGPESVAQPLRNRRFAAILRAEQRRRAAVRTHTERVCA